MAGVFLLPLQLVLDRIVRGVAVRQPSLFARLGRHCRSIYLIDPVNLPVVLVLAPDPRAPELRVAWRGAMPRSDCRIAGGFLTLLALIDGRRDGDALFFSRDLTVEGDIDAVVTLRNALDDLDTTLVTDIVTASGPLRLPLEGILRFLRSFDRPEVHNAG
ncbi:MAG TPA: SCP2 sterol-binding domain-containing protein [Aestuariivirga sp.]|nr:SCP2 sterol-binding domain-containing protein [Aestuariivirga sp.]